MTCCCSQPRALPPPAHWMHLLSRSWLLQYSSLYCITNFPLFTALFPSAYSCTVIPSVLNSRVASVHYLQFFWYFSHLSPPSHILSPSLYQNYPGHKWPPHGWAQLSRLSPQQQHLTRWSLASLVSTIPHSPLTSFLFFPYNFLLKYSWFTVVLQKSDSVFYIFFFRFFSIIGYWI